MIKKTKLALGIATATLAMAGFLTAPAAEAHAKKAHKVHAKKHHTSSTTSHYTTTRRISSSYVPDSSAKVDALESQLQSLQSELNMLRSEMSRGGSSTDTAKVQELEQWMSSVKSGRADTDSKDNMMFFRGGFAHADNNRGGTIAGAGALDLVPNTDPNGSTEGGVGSTYADARASQDAWYFGAGFDFSLNKDLFGLMNGTEVLAELMFDYKEFKKSMPNSPLATTNGKGLATVNQLTLAASPKIKLFKGQAFRPWLIPVGFELSVISPPSDAITVLNPGMQFGIGADYKVWKDLYVGADARYHYAVDTIDGVNTNGVTAGGYLGIGF